jgi:hypothetical protein
MDGESPKRWYQHCVETVYEDLVESIVVESLSELSRIVETFYETALRQAIDALGDENVIDGVVVEAYAHTPTAQRLRSALSMRAALDNADIPDVGALYRAFVVVSGIVSEAADMVVTGDTSEDALARFRRRMLDRGIDALKAAIADALHDESLARSITAFTAIHAVYDGISILIDDLCATIRMKRESDGEQE